MEDILVGKEGNWLITENGKLRLKQQAAGLVDDPPLENNETIITSNKSYAEWTNPNDSYPRHLALVTNRESLPF